MIAPMAVMLLRDVNDVVCRYVGFLHKYCIKMAVSVSPLKRHKLFVKVVLGLTKTSNVLRPVVQSCLCNFCPVVMLLKR